MGASTRQLVTAQQQPKLSCDVGAAGATAHAVGRLMGTDCEVRATCSRARDALEVVNIGWAAIVECEQLWSRFSANSELSQLNRHAREQPWSGETSDLTATLIAAMVWAHQYTAGWVDAALLPEVIGSGYDRDFSEIAASGGSSPGRGAQAIAADERRTSVMANVTVHDRWVDVGVGVQLDSGGIGKGLAADLVAELLMREGAFGALVNLGGDLRAVGRDQHDRPWIVEAADEFTLGAVPVARWEVTDSGIATSSVARRSWRGGHHLIDPHTRRPSCSNLLAVTVLGPNALAAEVSAKAALLMGDRAAVEWLTEQGAAAVLTGRDGALRHIG